MPFRKQAYWHMGALEWGVSTAIISESINMTGIAINFAKGLGMTNCWYGLRMAR